MRNAKDPINNIENEESHQNTAASVIEGRRTRRRRWESMNVRQ